MINFNYIADYKLVTEENYINWLERLIVSENRAVGEISYIFCSDAYLLEMNERYLNHETYTDIITFDYTDGNRISGDIFISIERVKENAEKYDVKLEEELRRVMSHGILHLVGYSDKEEEDINVMRTKEEEKMKLFHVEQK